MSTTTTTASTRPVAAQRAITPNAAAVGASFHHIVAGPVTTPTGSPTPIITSRLGPITGGRLVPVVAGMQNPYQSNRSTTYGTYTGGSGTITRYPTPTPPPVYGGGSSSTVATPAQTNQGGTVGGFNNAMSGDLLGRLGLTLPRALEILALILAGWLGWKYLSRKASGKRR